MTLSFLSYNLLTVIIYSASQITEFTRSMIYDNFIVYIMDKVSLGFFRQQVCSKYLSKYDIGCIKNITLLDARS